jgi:hypothetical protein
MFGNYFLNCVEFLEAQSLRLYVLLYSYFPDNRVIFFLYIEPMQTYNLKIC